MKMIIRWRTPTLLLTLLISSTLAAEDVPPGLVAKDSDQDLIAEASVQEAQKREATLSNSYGEPLPPGAYGVPDLQINVPDHQPAPIYGVPDVQNLGFQTPPGAYGPPTPNNIPASGYGPPGPTNLPSTGYEGPPPPVGPPKQSYGPPKQTYGPPKQNYGPPRQSYGPPQKQEYGPPPRQEYGPPPPKQEYGPPKHDYGPPKQMYGPPKPVYGPPKKNHLPSKQNLPKPSYGPPFKPQKLHQPKPIYGPPKQTYGPPKQEYGPPKQEYGPPKQQYGPPKQTYGPPKTNYGVPQLPLQELPPISLPPINLPPPIYGTPIHNIPDLRPNFPIPTDTYGPPGLNLGSGPIDQILIHDIDNNINYGPPQPDPNPRPPHPGIPAPPTPPHVQFDGWKPIPGVSLPQNLQQHQNHEEHHHQHQEHHHQHQDQHQQHQEQHHQHHHHQEQHHQHQEQHQNQHQNNQNYQGENHHQTNIEVIDINHQDLPSLNQVNFQTPHVETGYSNVHQDVLASIDLNAIVGGDSNGIDQSKTVFEAHYTEQQPSAPSGPDKPSNNYGVPLQLPNIQYHGSFRQNGAKGLIPPSGVYGVPPGTSYGVPPQQYGPPKNGLPIPHGSFSGGGHNGLPSPRHPIKFRESIANGVFQHIGSNQFKDDFKQSPAYLPPPAPVREVKDINQQTGNHGFTMSIEPSNLFSLPHENNPVSFLNLQMPSNLYGSPIDSYSVPLHTVADNSAAGSSVNAIAAALDGTILNNISNLDAAAILKHCPYHEAILRAAQRGEAIPADIASSYVASLSSLGNSLSKSQHGSVSSQNGFNTGSGSVNYISNDLATASNSLTEVTLPNNSVNNERGQKGMSLNESEKDKRNSDDNRLNVVSEQILKTSEKIKNLSEETKLLQQKIVSTSNNINQISGHLINYKDIPVKGKHSFSYQIQSSDGTSKPAKGAIQHDQLLSEGLLQSILEAIEHPQHPKKQSGKPTKLNTPHMDFSNVDVGGLVLPAGYEPIDHTKVNKGSQNNQDLEVQSSNLIYSFNQHTPDCKKPSNLVTETIVVPPENLNRVAPVYEVGNDVAVYFNDKIDDNIDSNERTDKRTDEQKNEPVTEISVATSISEDYGSGRGDIGREFGDRIEKKQ